MNIYWLRLCEWKDIELGFEEKENKHALGSLLLLRLEYFTTFEIRATISLNADKIPK